MAGASPEEVAGGDDTALAAFRALAETDRLLAEDHEIPALLRALDGRFIAPVAGGDVLRSPAILPTGRNLHGFDPYRIPSAFALADGRAQVEKLLARHASDGGAYPESIALVLWGSDNLKSEGAPVAQALALMGAAPRFDGYGRLCGAVLIPLEDLAARASTWWRPSRASSAISCRSRPSCWPRPPGSRRAPTSRRR